MFSPREEWVLEKRNLLYGLFIILIISLYLGTGFYSVEPHQTGITLHFGKVVGLTEPGCHYGLPRPFGDRILVDTGVIARVESGYRTLYFFSGSEPAAYLWEFTHNQGRYIKVLDEALAITGDENLIDLNVLCYFKIINPVIYALDNQDSYETLRSLLVHEVHNILGACRLDSLLTNGRGEIQETLLGNLQDKSAKLSLGVEILKVYLQEAHPPLEVVPEYRAVASAREKKNEIVHQATAYKNNLLPRKRGEAALITLDAQAYVIEKTSKAEGEARAFLLKQRDFSRFVTVQQDRLRWEAEEKTLKNKILFIIPSVSNKRIFLSKTKPGESRDE